MCKEENQSIVLEIIIVVDVLEIEKIHHRHANSGARTQPRNSLNTAW
jgi:hypothetical protein